MLVQPDVHPFKFKAMKVIEHYEIIGNIKLIHATYLIFAPGVKPWSRKMKILANKKGKIICLDSPHQPVIKIKYLRNFQS
jgi:hypothetical protein